MEKLYLPKARGWHFKDGLGLLDCLAFKNKLHLIWATKDVGSIFGSITEICFALCCCHCSANREAFGSDLMILYCLFK
jgi:hypothetical protein